MAEQITVNAVGRERYEKLRELVKKTNKENPKSEDLAALGQYFDEQPELWQATGNMTRRTLDHLLRTYYRQSGYVQECVTRQLDEMPEQLGYSESSSLERTDFTFEPLRSFL